MIGKLFVKIKFFTLVNLIMEKEVIKELLQFNLTNDIKSEMNKILNNSEYVKTMQNNYGRLKEKLGEKGAAQRVAKKIVYDMLNSRID
jgi:lipid-A-disaccharide synthase